MSYMKKLHDYASLGCGSRKRGVKVAREIEGPYTQSVG